jgi:hypothetical protein
MVLVEIPEENRPLERPGCGWQVNVKWMLWNGLACKGFIWLWIDTSERKVVFFEIENKRKLP